MSFFKLLLGLIFLGFGGLFLAAAMGVLPSGVWPWVMRFWPVGLLLSFALVIMAKALKNIALGVFALALVAGAFLAGGYWLSKQAAKQEPRRRPPSSAWAPLSSRRSSFGAARSAACTPSPRSRASAGRSGSAAATSWGARRRRSRGGWRSGQAFCPGPRNRARATWPRSGAPSTSIFPSASRSGGTPPTTSRSARPTSRERCSSSASRARSAPR